MAIAETGKSYLHKNQTHRKVKIRGFFGKKNKEQSENGIEEAKKKFEEALKKIEEEKKFSEKIFNDVVKRLKLKEEPSESPLKDIIMTIITNYKEKDIEYISSFIKASKKLMEKIKEYHEFEKKKILEFQTEHKHRVRGIIAYKKGENIDKIMIEYINDITKKIKEMLDLIQKQKKGKISREDYINGFKTKIIEFIILHANIKHDILSKNPKEAMSIIEKEYNVKFKRNGPAGKVFIKESTFEITFNKLKKRLSNN